MSGRSIFTSTILYGVTIAMLLFIAAPLLVTMSLSVSDTQFVSFPPKGFTLAWYGKVLRDPDFQSALYFSLWLAASATPSRWCGFRCRAPQRSDRCCCRR